MLIKHKCNAEACSLLIATHTGSRLQGLRLHKVWSSQSRTFYAAVEKSGIGNIMTHASTSTNHSQNSTHSSWPTQTWRHNMLDVAFSAIWVTQLNAVSESLHLHIYIHTIHADDFHKNDSRNCRIM